MIKLTPPWRPVVNRVYRGLDDKQYTVLEVAGKKGHCMVRFMVGDGPEQVVKAHDFRLQVHAPCRRCGCTDFDCRECVKRTGHACRWVEPNLCSACVRMPVAAV